MWPENHILLKNDQVDHFDKDFTAEFLSFIKNENLDDSFKASFKAVYLPLAKWIESNHSTKPIVIGLNGGQGSGKSTLCKLLVLILETLFNKSVLHLSIDDLYLSRNRRLQLAKDVHPLLKVRGVPGTHDAKLGIELLNSLKNKINTEIKLPVFDKAQDDLLPESEWSYINKNYDIILFEGWCVGAKPQLDKDLIKPVNLLEEISDTDGAWRQYINKQLSEQYSELFSYIDHLIMLKVPDMESVLEWRTLQEEKLKITESNKSFIKSENDIKEFIMYFERITTHCLKEMPKRADVVLSLNKQHQITKVEIR